MSIDDLVIDETNFDQYFFDVTKHRPQKGQVLACYEATAELVDGDLKRVVIDLLLNDCGGSSVPNILQKTARATEEYSIKIAREMAEDLLNGMSMDEVATKPYKFKYQQWFYTNKEYIPKGDRHWWSMSLVDVTHPDGPTEL